MCIKNEGYARYGKKIKSLIILAEVLIFQRKPNGELRAENCK